MVYIGVVGQIAVGKGVLVDYLTKKLGFVSFSLSSIIHDEIKKRDIKEFTRETLQNIGDELREKYGDDVLARRAIKKIQNSKFKSNYKRVIIEGIRNPGEIEYLKTLPNFVLIGVKANRVLRFKRLLSRAKPWDPKNWNDFIKIDRRDLGIGQSRLGQQVRRCLAYCDYLLINNKDKKDFERKIDRLVKKIFKLTN